MEFHLEKGAGLFGSSNPLDYPILARGLPFGTFSGEYMTSVFDLPLFSHICLQFAPRFGSMCDIFVPWSR